MAAVLGMPYYHCLAWWFHPVLAALLSRLSFQSAFWGSLSFLVLQSFPSSWQTKGTGMGKIYAPSLADIKVGYDKIILEQKLKDKMSAEVHEHFTGSYAKYLDDVWLMWRRSWTHLTPVISKVMNSIDSNIKYTFESSEESPQNLVAYLDTNIKILEGGWVDVDIFQKKTDTFNYLGVFKCLGGCKPCN